jgi:hypothetical protein
MSHDDSARDRTLELVAVVYSQDELALLTSRLRSESIWVVEQGARHVALDWALTVALGGVRLLVHRADAADARLVLAQTTRRDRGKGVFAQERLLDLLMALVLVMVSGIPPPARMPAWLIGAAREERAV